MAEAEEQKNAENVQDAQENVIKPVVSGASAQSSSNTDEGSSQESDEEEGPRRLVTSSPEFIESLFADGNECITAANGILPVKDETRLILALFS